MTPHVALRRLLLVGLVLAESPALPRDVAEAPRLRRALEGRTVVQVEGRALRAPALRAFYRLRDFAPAWDPEAGGVERAAALLEVLRRAGDHGLDPGAYQLDAGLRRPPDDRTLARELLLTDALLRYARDVRVGRVRPGEIEGDWAIPVPAFDVVSEAAGAVEADRLIPWLAALPPSEPGYARLVQALARYREMAARGGPAALGPGPLIRPGARDDRLPALRRRLAVEEDPPPLPESAAGRYDPPLEAAVRRFQARHGLAVDGIVGPHTRGALDVPLAARARQIALNLERWRWLPRDLGARYVAVNAAAATLTMVEEEQVVLASRVVVGDPAHPTPVLQARLGALVLNPPWTVPESIVADEILPELRRNPRYLADNDIVILDRLDTDPFGLAIDWSRVSGSGPLPRLQQRPGPRNPLGRIKFDLPNRFDTYLHDTPATALFAHPVRTRSHGCVRVERAAELATYLLAGQELGDRDALERAIAMGDTRWVPVERPVPVYLLYWTAFVDEGTLHFRDDPYGRDRRLREALDARGAPPARPAPASGATGCPG